MKTMKPYDTEYYTEVHFHCVPIFYIKMADSWAEKNKNNPPTVTGKLREALFWVSKLIAIFLITFAI
jgi:hypothetical protein